MIPTNRPEPMLPASARRTFSILMPAETHWRKATCKEVDCPRYLEGWRVRVELLDDRQKAQIRRGGWRFRELAVGPGETWWVFEAGQRCFTADQHRVQLGKPELFIVRDGDHRGNPRGTPVLKHKRPESWVDQFSEHQDQLARAREQS